MEVEGWVALKGTEPREFHYTQRAQIGLFGGSARGMLNVCAMRIADKIMKDVTRSLTG